MIRPLSFHCVRAEMARVAGWLVLLMLVSASSAYAGEERELETFIRTGPPPFTTSTTADFTFESNLTNRPGDAEFWCALDDEPYAPCSSGTWHREGITPGPHLFWVYAHDKLLNRVDATPANWEWVVEAPGDAGTGDTDGGVPPGDAGSGDIDGGSPADAGSGGDGGSTGSDAGTGDTDGGSPESDAGSGRDGGSPTSDAGSSGDGGSSGNDAGSSGNTDGGSPGDVDGGTDPADDGGMSTGDDGGTPDTDAGTPDEDGGPTDPVPPGDVMPPDALDYLGSGVGCTGAPAPGAMTGLLLLLLALRRRRRS